MPETSQSHADIQVVEGGTVAGDGLAQLEANIQRAVEAIQALQQERSDLREQLEDLRQTVKDLESSRSRASSQEQEVQQFIAERNRLLQDRARTAARVESMLKRLQELGFE